MTATLLHYRSWHGQLRGPLFAAWPIARVALTTLLRRRLFWVLYAAGLLLFLMFFMGTYLLDWAETQLPETPIQIGNLRPDAGFLRSLIRRGLHILDGSRETFSYFFSYQATMVIITLAMAGTIVLGNDFTHRSLPFYLSKPIGRWHYLLGKGIAIAVVTNMLTTLPAVILYIQHGMEDYHYFLDVDYFRQGDGPAGWLLLVGLLGYGFVLTMFLSIFLLAVAAAVRRPMPFVMAWISLFLFPRVLGNLLVRVLDWNPHWRHIDLWWDMSLLGHACLGYHNARIRMEIVGAGLTLAGVSMVCLIFLHLRTRAIDVIN